MKIHNEKDQIPIDYRSLTCKLFVSQILYFKMFYFCCLFTKIIPVYIHEISINYSLESTVTLKVITLCFCEYLSVILQSTVVSPSLRDFNSLSSIDIMDLS